MMACSVDQPATLSVDWLSRLWRMRHQLAPARNRTAIDEDPGLHSDLRGSTVVAVARPIYKQFTL
jgi:hypothetical protein